MQLGKIPDQVLRLAIIVILFVAAMIYVRHIFVPETFGETGHYRAAAVDEAVALEPSYAGWQVCIECHEEEGEAKRLSNHHTLSCEVCHGPSADHVADDEVLPHIPQDREACLYCHRYMPSRPTGYPQIIELRHNSMKPCTACHNPHDPRPPETPESCGACHARIARTKAVSHHSVLDCETCHLTNPDHREHPRQNIPQKPGAREFCGGCHGPDGDHSLGAPQVDMSTHGGNYLCWQCHYPHHPES